MRSVFRTPLAVTALMASLTVLGLGTRAASQTATLPPPQPANSYKYFPSNRTDDGRFLAIAGGATWKTLSGTKVSIGFAAPRITPWFEIAVFDGDTGRVSPVTRPDGTTVSQQVWDRGMLGMKYTLYADQNGLGNEADLVKIGEWDGNAANPVEGENGSGQVLWRTGNSAIGPQTTMPNNDWFMINVITSAEAKNLVSGHYFYVLRVENPEPNTNVINSFKVRTTGTISVEAQAISLYAPLTSGTSEERILAPDWGKYPMSPFDLRNLDNTTYDGTWEFELDVPEKTDFFTVWDGDLDYGSANVLLRDMIDEDTPSGLPAWATGFAFPDSAAAASPFDDSNSPRFRRSNSAISLFSNTPGVPDVQEAIEYDVIAPDGKVYRNSNPSGNQEWEQFRISADPGETRQTADYAPNVSADGTTTVPATGLPAGIYRIRVRGMDLENLNAYRFFHKSLGEDANGNPVRPYRPYLTVGDTVFLDRNGNGRQDDPLSEPGIPGVRLEWYDGDGSGTVKDVALTDAYGLYSFGGFTVREGDIYTVKVAPENFQPGGALASLTATTTAPVPGYATVPASDGLSQIGTLGNVDLYDYDFGFIAPPMIGCPPSVETVAVDGQCYALVNPGAATSPQSPFVTLVGVRSDGQALNAAFPVGVTTITWTATNALGQTAMCTQTITVLDRQPPTITCPPNTTVQASSGQTSATVNVSTPTTADNCGGSTVTGVRSDGLSVSAGYPVGTTTVTWTVSDASGNTANCTQDVTVTPPPVATNPGTGTIGYWKNHKWPVKKITVGGVNYSSSNALKLFPGNGGKQSGDKSCDLFAQLVAAKLNLIIGNDGSCISGDIAAADAWLVQHPAGSGVDGSSAAWSQISAVHDRLDRYNNGLLCAPHRG